ncbi:MAG: DUF6378 domain-containing protein [Butyricicoccaceae bacterium]
MPRAEGIAVEEEEKECAELTQEKYEKVAAAMRRALIGICGDFADVGGQAAHGGCGNSVGAAEREDLRAAGKLSRSRALPSRRKSSKLEDEPDEGEGEAKKLTRAAVLEKARACVCGEREEDYGSPEDSFGCIAELWETYLRAACVSPDAIVTVTAADVAMLMALLKIARVGTSCVGGTADSFVDLAGYAPAARSAQR